MRSRVRTSSLSKSADSGIGPGSDAPTDVTFEASDDSSFEDGGCPLPVGICPCTIIPPFNGPQNVDGRPSEFCGMQGVPFDVAQGFNPQPPDASTSDIDTTAVLVSGWDMEGLHIFIRVRQAVVNPPTSLLWIGDGIEVFAAITGTPSGYFGAGGDEGLQVIVAPTTPAESVTYWWTAGSDVPPPLAPNLYAARIVPGGYNVELYLPWSVIAGQAVIPPAQNSNIALDFACDISAPGGQSRAFQSALAFQLPTGTTTCGTNKALQASCDDRTWCTWRLAGP
jgi:hypothetical protein